MFALLLVVIVIWVAIFVLIAVLAVFVGLVYIWFDLVVLRMFGCGFGSRGVVGVI